MVLPAALLLANVLLGAVGAGASMYQLQNNKQIYQMNKAGYDRKLQDWNKNVGRQGRSIRYPEHSYYGNSRSLGVSYANADAAILGTASGFGAGTFSTLRKWV